MYWRVGPATPEWQMQPKLAKMGQPARSNVSKSHYTEPMIVHTGLRAEPT